MSAAARPGNLMLVIAETREHEPTTLTLDLIGLAAHLARETGATVGAALVGAASSAAEALIAHGAQVVYLCGAETEEYEGEVWLPNIEYIARDAKPAAILMGHTPSGADLLPRLAVRLQSAAATGCVAVAADSGKLLFTRACYGGNVRETISFTTAPAIATVKAGVGAALSRTAGSGEIVRVAIPPVRRQTRVVERKREVAPAQRLEDAKIVVSGGRGLESAEGFKVLEDLARVLGAAVGSSRVPCDLGWCPHSWQIGLTGKTVTPDLYFAIGISGAGHHMAGCGNAKTIVAINTDPQAAIFREARFGIVGDYRKIVPALISAVSELDRVLSEALIRATQGEIHVISGIAGGVRSAAGESARRRR